MVNPPYFANAETYGFYIHFHLPKLILICCTASGAAACLICLCTYPEHILLRKFPDARARSRVFHDSSAVQQTAFETRISAENIEKFTSATRKCSNSIFSCRCF